MKSYEEYLRSSEWQEKRTKRLLLDNFTCQCCGSRHDLQVHHLSYDNLNLGSEDIYSDLITLCKTCHKYIEERKKEGKPKGGENEVELENLV